MARVRVRHGQEGPRHDPYGWTEIEFTRTDGKVFVFRHGGLGYERFWRLVQEGPRRWTKVDYLECHESKEATDAFNKATGMSPYYAERIPDLLLERYLRSLSPAERHGVLMCMEADDAMLRNMY